MPPPIGFQRRAFGPSQKGGDVFGAGEEKQGICSSLQRICILTGHVLWPALRAAGGTGGPLLPSCKRVTGSRPAPFGGFQKGKKREPPRLSVTPRRGLSCKRVTGSRPAPFGGGFAPLQKGGKPGASWLFRNPPKGGSREFFGCSMNRRSRADPCRKGGILVAGGAPPHSRSFPGDPFRTCPEMVS